MMRRHVLWKHRLKFAAVVLVCLILTGVFYVSLPDDTVQSRDVLISRKGLLNDKINSTFFESSFHDITIVIRDFEDFENSLVETANYIERNLGTDVKVLIIADHLPYPPVSVNGSRSIQILTLTSDLSKNYSHHCPLWYIKTKYVLFIPDGVKMDGWNKIKKASSLLESRIDLKAVAFVVGNTPLKCSHLNVSLKEWTITFQGKDSNNDFSHCSYIEGDHALLIQTKTLLSLAEPFARPFPYSFYVQAALKNWNIHIFKGGGIHTFHTMFGDFHSKWKRKQAQSERLNKFYKQVGIKREILKSGVSNYYGCTKKTARCFGSVIKNMPQFLYEGKWTPPCCLRALRESIAHVFGLLEKCQVRYWLEGGSLLGAARHGDIIPWDYDVDIGVYQDDIDKCYHLKQAKTEPYIDEDEYVWEKAREGDFYRVQYSETNHLHVDIFPFYSKNGVMTKNTWFVTHPQDREFPESFLLPLTKIKFAGIEASAPNNVRKFLEYKFGKNVIENPKYPNLQSPVL